MSKTVVYHHPGNCPYVKTQYIRSSPAYDQNKDKSFILWAIDVSGAQTIIAVIQMAKIVTFPTGKD